MLVINYLVHLKYPLVLKCRTERDGRTDPVIENPRPIGKRVAVLEKLGDFAELCGINYVQIAAVHERISDGPAARCDQTGNGINLPRSYRSGGTSVVDLIRKYGPAQGIGADLRTEYLAEVTITHGLRRDSRNLRCRIDLTVYVNAGEKERLVPAVINVRNVDGASEGEARLIFAGSVNLRSEKVP